MSLTKKIDPSILKTFVPYSALDEIRLSDFEAAKKTDQHIKAMKENQNAT